MSIQETLSHYVPFVPPPPPKFVTEDGHRVHGILAEFKDVTDVFHAAAKVRDAGYKRWDVHSPFPIHGIDKKMGIGRSVLPIIAASVGLPAAVIGGFGIQYFMNHIDYQFVVQGKPTDAWEPYLMVAFEIGILSTAFTCLLGMLAMNGLPRHNHPLFNSDRFLKCSDDAFMISIEAGDANFDPEATRELLRAAGATDIELVEDYQ
jgi:hypothetical protein